MGSGSFPDEGLGRLWVWGGMGGEYFSMPHSHPGKNWPYRTWTVVCRSACWSERSSGLSLNLCRSKEHLSRSRTFTLPSSQNPAAHITQKTQLYISTCGGVKKNNSLLDRICHEIYYKHCLSAQIRCFFFLLFCIQKVQYVYHSKKKKSFNLEGRNLPSTLLHIAMCCPSQFLYSAKLPIHI